MRRVAAAAADTPLADSHSQHADMGSAARSPAAGSLAAGIPAVGSRPPAANRLAASSPAAADRSWDWAARRSRAAGRNAEDRIQAAAARRRALGQVRLL